jgi:hypothetical protein
MEGMLRTQYAIWLWKVFMNMLNMHGINPKHIANKLMYIMLIPPSSCAIPPHAAEELLTC